ncbi:DMT family transporter [Cognatishimia sp. SS12]|uniref:DMT family transporter n=1 Tax=Cognatishimia sp. SS12 TaxID=2979465 RepID=UPI002330E42D|nr:DMT family transporter [Cognatishimia sp. SS12]MDC0738093.1 DMT family transporter [Cognatishimia sp. SS12]
MMDIAPRHWAMIAIMGFVWGSTFLLIELALEGLTPIWLAAGRIWFAALLLTVIWGLRGFRLFHGQTAYGRLAIASIGSSALPFFLISWGQQYVTSGYTGVCMTAIALMILPLAHVFVPGERMNLRKTVGFTMGFVGVVLLIGVDALKSSGAELEVWGRLSIFGATVSYAICSILVRRLPPVDSLGLATMLLWFGALVILPAALLAEGLPGAIDRRTALVIVVLGCASTAIANYLRVLVVREAGPTFMSLTNYQVPIWAVVMGALVLGEPLPPTLLMALALILSGVALSQYGALRRLFGARS